jgi:ParB family chromosome partitioning protein
MAAGFKKKPVPLERVLEVETAAAAAPIVGDPRLSAIAGPAPGVPMHTAQPRHDAAQEGPGAPPVYQVGGVYEIPLGLLKSNPCPPRAVYTNAMIDDMATQLLASGQRISATAYLGDHGEPILIEGETRFRGARAAGIPTLRVEIRPRPENERALYEEARGANVERNQQTPLDDAIRWKDLLARGVYPSQAAIAKALNIGEDMVSRTLALANLPTRVVRACSEHEGLLTYQMLNAIREFWVAKGSEDDTIALIFEAVKNGWGYRDVVSRRKAAEDLAEKGPSKRPRASREVLAFRGATGEFKMFDGGRRVQFVLNGLPPEAATEVAAKLKELFAKG